jgi:hypothetical protein
MNNSIQIEPFLHDLKMIEDYACMLRMRLEKGFCQNISPQALSAIGKAKDSIKLAIHYSNYSE